MPDVRDNGAGVDPGAQHAPGDVSPDGRRPAELDAEDLGPQATPDLVEAVRQVGEAGRASWKAASETSKALRSLVSADVSLARSAFGRTLALTGVSIVFGASAWLLLMAALIVALARQAGWPWWAALLSCALLSLVAAVVAARKGMQYFEHTRMQATRRQLARLGFGELADIGPRAGSSESSRDAAERIEQVADETPLKDRQGIDVTPP